MSFGFGFGANVQLPKLSASERRARDVRGCFVSKEYKEFTEQGNVEAIVSYFQKTCQSQDFISRWILAGGINPFFHPSRQLRAGTQAYDKFAGAIKNLEHGVCFGIGFHGTPPENVGIILRDGLDPRRRSGQLYGPGEYFSKDPAVSVGYNQGGLEMLVFIVVLPSTLTTASPTIGVSIPPDFLVVENNNHQLPIGTMLFSSFNNQQFLQTQQFPQQSKEIFDKQARTKEQIIRYLINAQTDLAAELYEKQSNILQESSKREIAWFVEKHVDEGLADAFFPDLPDPKASQKPEAAQQKGLTFSWAQYNVHL